MTTDELNIANKYAKEIFLNEQYIGSLKGFLDAQKYRDLFVTDGTRTIELNQISFNESYLVTFFSSKDNKTVTNVLDNSFAKDLLTAIEKDIKRKQRRNKYLRYKLKNNIFI